VTSSGLAIQAPTPVPARTGVGVGLLATHGLTKHFPGVLAVDGLDLEVRAGEIMALLGPNGAGKSTLIQVLAGLHPPDSYSGDMVIDGHPYQPTSVADAERTGVVLIPQEINVVPNMTVAENMFLNNEPRWLGMVDRPRMHAAARDGLRDFGVSVPVDVRMGGLDLATQQLVVIARAFAKRARLLILDEPTAALTEGETQRLFVHLRDLRARGVGVIFVSHRLTEVFAIADRILVMRDGRVHGDHVIAQTTREQVVHEMVGSIAGVQRLDTEPGAVVFEVSGVDVHDPDEPDRLRVADASLTLRAGEVVGLFGLVGAGCGALAKALFGSWPGRVAGSVRIDGREIRGSDPSRCVQLGIGMMSQDRRETLMLDASVADNVVLASLGALSPHGLLDVQRKQWVAADQARALRIRARSTSQRVGSLSGGNQQKVQVARWLTAGSKVLLLDDPTRGVDVGARSEIHALLRRMASEGCAQLLVSSDAEELLEMCDRILVMRGGVIIEEMVARDATEASLLSAAAGL
jgi:ABC-type sugar transport system ATPase subunit